MSWFRKKEKLSINEVNKVVESMFKDEKQEIKNDFIKLAVSTLTSTVMSPNEQVDIFNKILGKLHEIDGEVSITDLKRIADESYSYMINNFIADVKLLNRINDSYNELMQLSDDCDATDFRFDDIVKYSIEARQYIEIDDESMTIKCKYRLAGLSYRNDLEKKAALSMSVDDAVELEREINNKYDDNAVKIITSDGKHIGYVERALSKYITDNFSNIIETTITEIDENLSNEENSIPELLLKTIIKKDNNEDYDDDDYDDDDNW